MAALQVELYPEKQAFTRGAIGDALPSRRALAHLQNPLQAALTMDHAKPVVEPSNDAGIGFTGFARVGRKSGCYSRGRRFQVHRRGAAISVALPGDLQACQTSKSY